MFRLGNTASIALLRSSSSSSSSRCTTSAPLFYYSRSASTLVVSEPIINTSSIPSTISPATLSAVTAAQKLHDGPITLLLPIMSSSSSSSSSSSEDTNTTPTTTTTKRIPAGLTNVIVVNSNNNNLRLAENVAQAVQLVQEIHSFSHVVTSASKFGMSFLPRAAAMLNVSPVTDVVEIVKHDTFVRPMYAGNAMAKVQSKNTDLQLLTVRPTAFDKSEEVDAEDVPTTELELMEEEDDNSNNTTWISENVSKSDDRPDLTSARVVVSGGRGMKNGENFGMLELLADRLGGDCAVGASRAAVDAGFVPNDLQVGQTGKVVAPDLYVAVGISGAIQHLSGMKDSKTIVAINSDPEAPIFQVADYGLTADLFEAVPELIEKI